MNKNKLVECFECGNAHPGELQCQTIENVDLYFIECPECGDRIISFIMDQEARRLRADVRLNLKHATNPNKPFDFKEKKRRKYKKLSAELNRLLAENYSKYPHLIAQIIEE